MEGYESETRDDTIIKTLDTDCENVEFLKKFRYKNLILILYDEKHVKNCALQKYI